MSGLLLHCKFDILRHCITLGGASQEITNYTYTVKIKLDIYITALQIVIVVASKDAKLVLPHCHCQVTRREGVPQA